MPYTLSAYGLSDPGLVRENNEDIWGCVPEYHFFAIADGMGGHQAGEVASREAVLFLCTQIRKQLDEKGLQDASCQDVISFMRLCLEDTNSFVYELSTSHDLLTGMGTTLCCLYFHDDFVVWAHVGDSRIYRLRNHKLEQLTQDHSLLRELVDGGKIQEQDKEEFLYKNIITKAVGTDIQVEPAVNAAVIQPKDTYLLCTDGLSDLLTRAEIEQQLNQPYAVEEKVRALIAEAKQKGGYDNITVVLVEVISDEKENIPRQ